MRNLIGRRQGEITPRTRPRSGTLDNPIRNSAIADTNSFIRTVDSLLDDVESDLASAQTNTESLQEELTRLAAQFREVRGSSSDVDIHFSNNLQRAADMERARLELQNSKRQCELVKSLLADATAEKEIMYEVRRIFLCLIDELWQTDPIYFRPSTKNSTPCITMPICPKPKRSRRCRRICARRKRPRTTCQEKTRAFPLLLLFRFLLKVWGRQLRRKLAETELEKEE